MTKTKPRYTVELTTEGWQIKDNVMDIILADVFGSASIAKVIAQRWNTHARIDAEEGFV